jgi:hypothetical protein
MINFRRKRNRCDRGFFYYIRPILQRKLLAIAPYISSTNS